MPPVASQPHLLAVSLETRTGTALFGQDGKLCSFTSLSRASGPSRRRHVKKTLSDAPALEWIVSQGEAKHAAVWERDAMRQAVRVQRVDNKTWRQAFRLAGSGEQMRRATERLARRAIDAAGMPQPVVLPADCAEAICVGLWASTKLGLGIALQGVAAAPPALALPRAQRPARVANG